MTAATGGADHGAEHGSQPVAKALMGALAILAPAGLLTGILYYFGYVTARAFYSYFGINLSVLNFSTTSFLIRNADTLFRPLSSILFLSLIVLVGHRCIVTFVTSPQWMFWFARIFGLLSLCLGAYALLSIYGLFVHGGLDGALSLAASVVLFEYALWMFGRANSALSPGPPGDPERFSNKLSSLLGTSPNVRRGILAAVVLVACFWAITDVAYKRGTENAALVELSLPLQSQAVVYSSKELSLPLPDAAVTELNGQSSAYHFRYNHLRPLVYANARWFLLPLGWTHVNRMTVVVLPDEPGEIRVDLAP